MDVAALRLAIELVHMPARARALRAEPVPGGVAMLLLIAAGEEATTSEAAALTDRPPDLIKQAAAFFIEQILLFPDADSYRVLGASDKATSVELRRNMALLLRWLHPDVDALAERSMFAGRVTRAWEDLKTPERRAAYDAGLRSLAATKAAHAARSANRSGTGHSTGGKPTRDGAGHKPGMPVRRAGTGPRGQPPVPPRFERGNSRSGLLARMFQFLLGPRRR